MARVSNPDSQVEIGLLLPVRGKEGCVWNEGDTLECRLAFPCPLIKVNKGEEPRWWRE